MISFNLFGVRYFGESEFYFCLIKSGLSAFASLYRSLMVTDPSSHANHRAHHYRSRYHPRWRP